MVGDVVVGVVVGAALGKDEGVTVGVVVGDDVGAAVGASGAAVGATVGTEEVGTMDGAIVGQPVRSTQDAPTLTCVATHSKQSVSGSKLGLQPEQAVHATSSCPPL